MSTKPKSSDSTKDKGPDSTWKKALIANAEWPDKDEFLDVIYWIRQALGIVLGLGWGLLPLKGFLGVLLFVIVNAGVIYFYVMNFQNIDEEEWWNVGNYKRRVYDFICWIFGNMDNCVHRTTWIRVMRLERTS